MRMFPTTPKKGSENSLKEAGMAKPERKKVWTAVRAVSFMLLLVLILVHVQDILGISEPNTYSTMETLYRETPESLDAVYFGGSNVYAFWQPSFGWRSSGIAVQSCAISALPATALKNMIVEVRKTQPNTLCIINLNTFRTSSVNDVRALRTLSYLHFSKNKLSTIKRLTRNEENAFEHWAEYLWPILRFHSRWSSSTEWDYYHDIYEYESNSFYYSFLNGSEDLTESYVTTKAQAKQDGYQEEIKNLKQLLSYLKAENVPALFVVVPQALPAESVRLLNTFAGIVKKKGYPCLDLLNDLSRTGLSLTNEFYEGAHTNLHGSLKFSKALSDYLVENYGFKDKRGQKGWERWDATASLYERMLTPYALPFELDDSPRCDDLALYKMKLYVDGTTFTLAWKEVAGADLYRVYRQKKEDGKGWELAAELEPLFDGSDTAELPNHRYTETDLEPGCKYFYTVVPCKVADGTIHYGLCNYYGRRRTVPGGAEETVPEETVPEESGEETG